MKLNSPQSTDLSTITHYSALCVANLLQFCCKICYLWSKTLDFTDYSTIVATRPEPTVLPPSRTSYITQYKGYFSTPIAFSPQLHAPHGLLPFSHQKNNPTRTIMILVGYSYFTYVSSTVSQAIALLIIDCSLGGTVKKDSNLSSK